MARGRPPKKRPAPPRPEGDYSNYRVAHYHLCGLEIYAQPYPHRSVWGSDTYYFHWFETRCPEDQVQLRFCPQCHTAVTRASVRLPGEQYLYELAQETLLLQLSDTQQDESDAQEDAPP